MGLWSKGVERSQTGELRRGDDILGIIFERLSRFMRESGYTLLMDRKNMCLSVKMGCVMVKSDLNKRKFNDMTDFSVMVTLHEDIVYTHKHITWLTDKDVEFANHMFRNIQCYLKSKDTNDLYTLPEKGI